MTDVQSTEHAAPTSSPRQVTVQNSQVGVVGPNAHVEGGIHYHNYQIPPPANPTEARNRAAMLQLVHNTWIKGYFEQSLHGAVLLELGKEYDPKAVERPWDMVLYMPERPDQSVPKGAKMLDILDQMSGSLLILGEPGSGKTFTLLELARDAIARAQADSTQPIPVVFNLSSWAVKSQPLAEWLADELHSNYYVPKKLAQSWVKNDIFLLLLDGLDEVRADRRDACVEAINVFRREHGLVPLVVCSRNADYEALSDRLKLQGAIRLRPLSDEQVDQYLAGAGLELRAVRATLQHDPVLREVSHFPLFLSVMALAYMNLAVSDLQTLTTLKDRRQHLFDTYVRKMFHRRGKSQHYTPEQVICRLVWLADNMVLHNQTTFFIDQIQPSWLKRAWAYNVFLVIYRIFIGSSSLCILGALQGAMLFVQFDFQRFSLQVLFFKIVLGIGIGIIVGGVGGMLVGLGKINKSELEKIERVEILSWSSPKVEIWSKLNLKRDIIYGTVWGLGIGTILMLILNQVIFMIIGVFVAIIVAIALDLKTVNRLQIFEFVESGLRYEDVETRVVLNQGIRLSAENAVKVGLVTTLVIGVLWGLVFGITRLPFLGYFAGFLVGILRGTRDGLLLGLWLGYKYGGLATVQHICLRLVLSFMGCLSWNYAHFLNYCVDRIFLRRVGGGYVFIHRMLQDHFAALTPERQREIVEGIEGQ